MKYIYKSSLLYILLLLSITFILYITDFLIVKYKLQIDHHLNKNILEYFYIFFFSIISGILLFFGFKNFNDTLYIVFKNRTLTQLTSATIVISFSLLYAAYFQKILIHLLNVNIGNDVWKNVIGYVFGRIILISIIFIMIYYYAINKN